MTYFQLVGGAKNYITDKLALDLKGTFGISLGDPGGSQSFQATFGLSYVF